MSAVRVAVVGGGVIGLSCAWQLARAGADVTLIEPDPAQGASRIAAGMLAPITEAHPTEPALLAAGRRAVDAWPAFAADLTSTGIDPGYRTTGTLVAGYSADDVAALDELAARLATLGLDVERLTGTACRRSEPALAPGVRGGLSVPGDHSVDNRALLRALWAALEVVGVHVVTDTVEAPLTLDADVMVLAAGAWTPRLTPTLAGLVRPVRGENVRLVAGRHTPVLTRTVRALVDGRGVYLVPRTTGELVVGATQDEVGFDRTVTAGGVHRLLTDARRVLPSIDEYALVETSAGLRPMSTDGAPLVGWVGGDTLVATGHGRNGILLAPLTAAIITHLVTGAGHTPDAAVAGAFAPDRFPAAAGTSRATGPGEADAAGVPRAAHRGGGR
ncbi:glycine oxidase ThiO [Cryptosporangium aurantiacum]|uniref:glycine oxidase n=1 Tax=Cryptosporangium aurantiacum TaxID=134849 RepID=A0A1M7QFD5_9ACTN|nr:glycine oxidase ThiO [Cryptosporangium aurantiacum]SHN29318.1 glycine oxidase [Cryptosporangium aurantiacum]